MKSKLVAILALAFSCAFSTQLTTAFAQGTAFTYQGLLNEGDSPGNGSFDLTFALFGSQSGGTALAGPLTNTATALSNGLFTVTLDFGASVFNGANLWLEIAARTNGPGAFTTLSPRQEITSAPYAVRAEVSTSFTGAIADSQLSGNVAKLNGTNNFTGSSTFGGVILATNIQNQINGIFSGNGAAVTNVNLFTVNSHGLLTDRNTSASFSLAPTLAAASPAGLVTADVNGDGKLDLISADYGSDTLRVFTNNGTGGFVLASSPFVNGPTFLQTADVNGDGKPDLISLIPGGLVILINNGNGNFGVATSMVVSAVCVAAADVNGDGKVDLITVNQGAGSVSVFTNNGSGVFALASTNAVGYEPDFVATADVNGDGKIDLIAANQGDGTLSVLTNNGTGGFALFETLTVNPPVWIATADVNGDGKVDLISASEAAGTLTVLTNNGSGGFALSQTLAASRPWQVVATDINGDGKVDLAAPAYTYSYLTVFTNNGSGGFVAAPQAYDGRSSIALVAGDFNGDGVIDLAAANDAPSSLSVLFGNTQTGLNAATLFGFVPPNALASVPAANLTGHVPASALSAVPAGSLTGTVSDARLSTNVALLNGPNTFAGVMQATNANNQISGNFSGNFIGNGAALNNLNPANFGPGTLPDALLSANVALREGGNTFSGNQQVVDQVITGSEALDQSDGNFANYFGDIINWQAFTAGQSGLLTRVALEVSSPFSGSATGFVSIYTGVGTNGQLLTTQSAIFTNGPGFQNYALSSPPVVQPGNQYTICFGVPGYTTFLGWVGISLSNVYSGGISSLITNDIGFRTYVTPMGSASILTVNPAYSGRVGINNASPQATLDVGGAVHANNFYSGTGTPLAVLDLQAGADNTGTSDGKAIALAWHGGGYRHWIRSRHNTAPDNGNAIDFFVNTNSTAGASSAPGTSNVLVMTLGGTGNVGIGTSNPTNKLHVMGGVTFSTGNTGTGQSVVWNPGSASWTFTSDRNTKEHLVPVDGPAVLEHLARVPIEEWNYIGYGQRHIGPMAQDFHAQFPLSADDKTLNDADLHGVALAAIQGLNQKVEEQKRENEELKKRLSQLETLLGKPTTK